MPTPQAHALASRSARAALDPRDAARPSTRRADRDRGEDQRREADVRVHGEDDGPGDEEARERPRESRRHRALPERPRDRSTREAARRPCRTRGEGTRSSIHSRSERALPDERKRTPSRYSLAGAGRAPASAATRAEACAPARPPSARGAWRTQRRCPRRFSTYSWPPCDAPPTCTTSPREEEHLPAGTAEPCHPVDLLAEHEEVLVEQADRVGRLAPDEQRGAVEPLDLAHLVVVEAAGVERVQALRARRELADARGTRSRAARASARRAPSAAASRRC